MQRIGKIGSLLWAHRLASGGIIALLLVASVSSLLLFGRDGSPVGMPRQPQAGAGGGVTYQLTPGSTTPTGNTGGARPTPGGSAHPTPGGSSLSGTPASGSTSGPGNGDQSGTSASPTTTTSGVPSPVSSPTSLPGTPGTSPTPTPGLIDDATAIAPTTLTTAPWSGQPTLYLTVENTGTTTWGADQNVDYYYLACFSGCTSGTYASNSLGAGTVVAPGQSYAFSITWMLDSYSWTRLVHYTHWRMVHGTGVPMTRTPFGADMELTVTETGEAPLVQQTAPGCANPAGVTWAWTNTTGNTVSCTGGSLLMQQQGGDAPLLVPSVSVAGYDPNNNHVRIHVHFGNSSSTTFAGFAVNTSAPDGCGGERFWVRSDGTWQRFQYFKWYGQTTCTSQVNASGTIPAGTDFDLLYVYQQAANQFFFVNNFLAWDGGDSGPYGMPGLIVQGSSSSSSPVYFSQFEVDKPVGTTASYQLGG